MLPVEDHVNIPAFIQFLAVLASVEAEYRRKVPIGILFRHRLSA